MYTQKSREALNRWRKKPGNMAKVIKLNRKYRYKRRLLILQLLGNKCIKCGFDDIRALQVDHIDGGGTQHRKEKKNSLHKSILDSIKIGEKKYQLLCANCNWIKRIENKECLQPKYR